MARELLLDTGPLVSLLDRSQSEHARCVAFWNTWRGPVIMTEAVLTEATHLLARARGGTAGCLRFVAKGGAVLLPTGRTRIERALELVETYADVPMDFADATLVAVAEELGTGLVFTLDRRGFETFRWNRRRSFTIYP